MIDITRSGVVRMNVMYATDENYAEIAGISMESLLSSNKEIDEITIFIVEDGVTDESKDKLRQTTDKYGRNIVFIPKPDIRKLTGTELLTLRWSDSAFSRLYLDLVFENHKEVKKVLYLDCDTMIVDNLEHLWDIDIEDYLGAAVLECMSNLHKKIVGGKAQDNYFNSGVMLLNVERWKKEKAAELCTNYISSKNGKIEYVDQGVINGVLTDRIKVIEDPRYNLTAMSWDFSYKEMIIYRKPHHGYTEEQWENARKNPAIIHFTTSFLSTRPWFEGDDTPWTAKWRQFKAQSVWNEAPLRNLKKRKKHDLKIAVFKCIPRKIGVCLAGILHAYVKPLVFVTLHGR